MLQDAIECVQGMLLRREKRTVCKGRMGKVLLQRCDTESITLEGDYGGEMERGRRGGRKHAQ